MSTSAQAIADIIKSSVSHLTPAGELAVFMDICRLTGAELEVDWFIDGTLQDWEAGMLMKVAIVNRLNRAVEVRAIATSRGYLLPDDPTPRLQELNAIRGPYEPLPIGAEEATELASAAIGLCRVAKRYDNGEITFERRQPSWQLANFELSTDGMTAQSGDPLVDILGYQPDIDFVKRKRALDALARLDFSKRKPYFLFTADVIRGGRRESGTIVCWAKMREASGYNIHKRDVFAMRGYMPITLSNEWLAKSRDELLNIDSFVQALSFYDWLTIDDVCAFVDPQTHNNTLFSYEIEGVQRRAPSTPFVFQGEFRTLYLTPAQIEAVTRLVTEESAAAGVPAVSPYPALSRVVFGDPFYGWMLAGYNVLASKQRGDTVEQTRSLSFIGSRMETLLAEAAAGRLVVPVDLSLVQKAVDAGISAYGIGQTIISVLDGVGLTMFVSGKDDLLGFQPTVQALERASSGLSKILAAIDPESGTLDPRVLVAAIQLAPEANRYTATEVAALGAAQTDILGSKPIDVTTYRGIGELMQLIRAIYDFQPGVLG